MAKKLSIKQERFCEHYIITLCATEAAKKAGYSDKTAYSIGHENLRKPEIEKRIQKLKKERSERVQIDADWVLKQAKNMFEITTNEKEFAAAKGFLEMCGKHVNVGAFKEKKEIEHSGEIRNISICYEE